jgi:hypothetical protein
MVMTENINIVNQENLKTIMIYSSYVTSTRMLERDIFEGNETGHVHRKSRILWKTQSMEGHRSSAISDDTPFTSALITVPYLVDNLASQRH